MITNSSAAAASQAHQPKTDPAAAASKSGHHDARDHTAAEAKKPGQDVHRELQRQPERREAVYRHLARTEPALIHHLEQWRVRDELAAGAALPLSPRPGAERVDKALTPLPNGQARVWQADFEPLVSPLNGPPGQGVQQPVSVLSALDRVLDLRVSELAAAAQQMLARAQKVTVEAQAAEVSAMPPEQRADAIEARIENIERSFGTDAAIEFVARLAELNPSGLAESITRHDTAGHSYEEGTRDILAQGIDRAYERAPATASTMPYISPREQIARSLIDGLSDGLIGVVPQTSTLLADIVGRTGNDGLQADFVRSGLTRSIQNHSGNENKAPIYWEPDWQLMASMAPATRGSAQAAEEVIKFAERVEVPFGSGPASRGPESLNVILELFQQVEVDIGNGQSESGFITFMRAAVPADQPYHPGAPVSVPSTPLGDQQSFTLFLAVSGNDRLLEADGAGGKADPAATALTSKLFENYYDTWIDPKGLNITIDGTGRFGETLDARIANGLYAGYPIEDTMANFFQEALIDKNEDGAYRFELKAFVLDKIFQGFSPGQTELSELLDGTKNAAAHGASLLVLTGLSERDLLADLAAQSAENRQILTLLVGAGFAVGGTALGGPGAGLVSSEAATALLKYASGKAKGAIETGVVDYLVSQGVDRSEAQRIERYLGNPAEMGKALQGATGLPAWAIQRFTEAVSSNLDKGTAGALYAGLIALNSDPKPGQAALSPSQQAAIEDAIHIFTQVINSAGFTLEDLGG